MRRIAVAGPAHSGVSAVVAALSEALPDHRVVEWLDLDRGQTPDAVVFVVTAAAPVTPSQAALLDSVSAVPVIAAVSKIDLHRGWADIMARNRAALAAGLVTPPWVGVAADPDIGEPRIDDLVDAVRNCRIPGAALPAGRPPPHQRLGLRVEVITRRAELAQARLRLGGAIRAGCVELRNELQRQTGRLNRRGLRDFGEQVLLRVAAAVAEWDQASNAEFDAIMRGSGVTEAAHPAEPLPRIAARPPEAADPTEVRLNLLIGAVFGVGTALTVSRLLSGLVQGWASAAGAAVGLVLTLWVVASRRLLSERAAMSRWMADLVGGARQTLEERVASQALAAEVAMGLAAADSQIRPVRGQTSRARGDTAD